MIRCMLLSLALLSLSGSLVAQGDEPQKIVWPDVLYDIDDFTKKKKFEKALNLIIRAFSDPQII